MNETLIRASLDQSLLAIAALEDDNPAAAAAHASVANALALAAGRNESVGAGGARSGPAARSDRMIEKWFGDIELLALPPIETPDPPVVEPAPMMETSPGRRRADARRNS